MKKRTITKYERDAYVTTINKILANDAIDKDTKQGLLLFATNYLIERNAYKGYSNFYPDGRLTGNANLGNIQLF